MKSPVVIRLPDGDDVLPWVIGTLFFGSLAGIVLFFFINLYGELLTTNTPRYCYVQYYPQANQRYDYFVYRHRRFGADLKMAAAGSAEEAAHYVELLCH